MIKMITLTADNVDDVTIWSCVIPYTGACLMRCYPTNYGRLSVVWCCTCTWTGTPRRQSPRWSMLVSGRKYQQSSPLKSKIHIVETKLWMLCSVSLTMSETICWLISCICWVFIYYMSFLYIIFLWNLCNNTSTDNSTCCGLFESPTGNCLCCISDDLILNSLGAFRPFLLYSLHDLEALKIDSYCMFS